MRTTPCVLGALSLLVGCTQGTPDRPAGLGPTIANPPDASVELPSDVALLPPAVALKGLQPFDLKRSELFVPVVQVERSVPPISGGTLAASAGSAVLSDPDRDQVYVVDIAKKSVATVALSSGDEPGRVAIYAGRAYVALRAAGSLVTIDLATQKVSARLPVCAAPRGVMFDSVDPRVLVTCAGGDLVSVAADGGSVLAKVRLPADLRDVGRDARGLWVTQFRSAALLRLDAALAVRERLLPKEVDKVSAPALPSQGLPPGFGSAPHFAATLAYRTITQGDDAWMVHQRAQTTPILAPGTSLGGYGAGSANAFCEGGIVHTTITRFGATPIEAQAAFPQAVVPVDLGLSPDGRFVALIAPGNFVRQDAVPTGGVRNFDAEFGFPVSLGPAQQLYFTNTASLKRVSDTVPLGSSEGDCLTNAGRWEHRFPGEAIALQFVDAKTLLVQVRNPAELHVFRVDEQDNPRLSAVIALSSLAVRDTGHEVFHQNTGAGIACASCHGEVLDDGHVWEFEGIGPRRTQHLRGGFANNAPFHWSGDLQSFEALLDDVYQKRMAAAPLAPDARSALARWLDHVPLVPTEAADPAAAARGRSLFTSDAVGCARCHAGEALRAPGRYDVGTGGEFEVPSLHGVSLRLPLMHNGCADTIEKRFDSSCGGGDKHGSTSQLNAAELEDLVAYLGSL